MRYFAIAKGWEDRVTELPKRSTQCSYAYDLTSAEDIVIPSIWKVVINNFSPFPSPENKLKPVLVPTGIKVCMNRDEVFKIYVRSSSAVKKCLALANSVGIIDSDYFENPGNDGHVMIPLWNFGLKDYHVKKGERIAQGAFQKFLTVSNEDVVVNDRSGGFGSTGDMVLT